MPIYGLKVIDIDVSPRPSLNSSNPNDFIYNSIWATVKNWKMQMSTITLAAGASGYIEIAHGLSFIPASIIFTEINGGSDGNFFFGSYVEKYAYGTVVMESYCNSTNLHVSITNPYSTSKTFRVYSIIFADNGQ